MEDAEGKSGRRPKFSAFLSYSHADASAVRKLHSQLESYRLPKELGEVGALNEMSGRLGRVFRDREDLSAAESLSDAVTAALDQSEVLVVVCSPEAKASKWVGQEIAYFREHRPGKPILAAIVRGEPDEAFPDALTEGGAEPLAADLRREGDGWKLGFLKVVSGIAGVPLDALVQRDSQRQTRRVMAITGVSVLAALVMAIMTTVAIQSRNEAQFQQAEAEGLVAYMMGDLRSALEGVGRLDVMRGVNNRTLEYYSHQDDPHELSDERALGLAQILTSMSEDFRELKDYETAMEKVDRASRITGGLLQRNPSSNEVKVGHAHSQNVRAELLARMGEWEEALKAYEESARLANQLIEANPDRPDWLHQAAISNGDLCAVLTDRREEQDRALALCENALELSKKHVSSAPNDAEAIAKLALRYAWAGTALTANGRSQEGRAYYDRQLSLLEGLVRDFPQDQRWKVQLMQSSIFEAESADSPQRRVKFKAKARKLADFLITHDPENSDWRMWSKRIEKIN